MRKTFFLSLILSMLVLPLTAGRLAASTDSRSRQFDAISRLIEKADEALEAERLQEAIQLYGATIAAYRDFSTNFPDYRTELVQFRVSYCRHQLMSLLALQQAREAPAPATTRMLPVELARQVEKAASLCREGMFVQAEESMRALIAEHPDCAPAYLVLATTVLASGDLAKSRLLLEQSVELDEAGSAAARYNIAQLILRESEPDFDAARAHYRRARELGVPADSALEAVLDL